jgi:hypothetical protein
VAKTNLFLKIFASFDNLLSTKSDMDDPYTLDLFKQVAQLEQSRTNCGDSALDALCKPTTPDAKFAVDLESGPVLRDFAQEKNNDKRKKHSFGMLLLYIMGGFLVLIALVVAFFPDNEENFRTKERGLSSTDNRPGENDLEGLLFVPSHISEVPTEELFEAFPLEVAREEFVRRQKKRST